MGICTHILMTHNLPNLLHHSGARTESTRTRPFDWTENQRFHAWFSSPSRRQGLIHWRCSPTGHGVSVGHGSWPYQGTNGTVGWCFRQRRSTGSPEL